jgi:hypothetical protein
MTPAALESHLILVSDPAHTAMPTCGFPARRTPEAAKLRALSHPVPDRLSRSFVLASLRALHLDSRAVVPHLHHDTRGGRVGQYAGGGLLPRTPSSGRAPAKSLRGRLTDWVCDAIVDSIRTPKSWSRCCVSLAASLTATRSPGLDNLSARTRRAMRAWILVGYPGQGGASAPHRVSPWSSRTPFTYTERGVNPRNWSAWSNSPGAVCRVKENRYLTQPPVNR